MSNWTKEPWFCMDDGFSRKHPRPTIYAPGDELRYVAWFDDIPSIGAPTPNLENARRVVDCVNACAGVAEMGSVRELVEALAVAHEVVRDRLRMAEAAGNKKDIRWASEILADAQAALAKFRLEENQ